MITSKISYPTVHVLPRSISNVYTFSETVPEYSLELTVTEKVTTPRSAAVNFVLSNEIVLPSADRLMYAFDGARAEVVSQVIDELLCSMSVVTATVCDEEAELLILLTGEGDVAKTAVEQGSTIWTEKDAVAWTPSTEAVMV